MQRKRGGRPAGRHDRLRASHRPSTYIRSIESIRPGDKVVLWCRVSTDSQKARGNLANQKNALRAAVAARGGIVVGMVRFTGRAEDAYAKLYEASNIAAKAGAVLLAVNLSRFARHPDFDARDKDRCHLRAGIDELQYLRWVCGDVPLVTQLHPDATLQQEKSQQVIQGQRQKGIVGRPIDHTPGCKKRWRERWLPKVLRLIREGMSYRAIARTLRIASRTVRRWAGRFLPDGRDDVRG